MPVEYNETGQGHVLLLLHGWRNDLHSFDPLVPLLANDYKVISLDLPGFGGTEGPSGPWHIDDYIEFVSSFIKKLHIEDYFIVGHSFGGRIAVKGIGTGMLTPQKLVLISAAGVSAPHSIRRISYKIVAKLGRAITSIPTLKHFQTVLKKRLYKNSGSDYLYAGSLKDTYLNVIHEDLSKYAKRISIPTLLIWGALDGQTPLADGKRFSKIIKYSKLVVFKDDGHFVHQEKPQDVAKLINDFIS